MIIYLIKNIKDNKVYVGQSSNFDRRVSKHKSLLRKNKHVNSHLQCAWNLYGEDCFEFLIIDQAESRSATNKLESDYILKFKSFDRDYGYNRTMGGDCKVKFTQETIDKMSKSHTGKTHEYGDLISKALTGSHRPDHVKSKISASHKGKVISQEQRDKISKSLKGRIYAKRNKYATSFNAG